MSDYGKLQVRMRYSRNSDMTEPDADTRQIAEDSTPSQFSHRFIEATTTALTLDLSMFSSIERILMWNRSSTSGEHVMATWFEQHGSQAAGDFDLGDDNPDTILDNGGNTTFITNEAVDGGYVRIASAEDAANDGAYLISQVVDGDNLTLAPGASLTNNVQDTTATLSFEAKNKARVPTQGVVIVGGSVVPAGDLVIEADSGTPSVEILILGT